MEKQLFRKDESYTKLGCQLYEEAGIFVDAFFVRYSESPPRDIVKIICDRIEDERLYLGGKPRNHAK